MQIRCNCGQRRGEDRCVQVLHKKSAGDDQGDKHAGWHQVTSFSKHAMSANARLALRAKKYTLPLRTRQMTKRFTLHGIWLSGPTYKVALMLSLCGEPFDYVH